jgi:hypothetical protein
MAGQNRIDTRVEACVPVLAEQADVLEHNKISQIAALRREET